VSGPQSQRSSNDATDAYLGYAFQGLYALIVLLDAGDAEAVSVESQDDVVLAGAEPRLHQLKHSVNEPRPLALKSDAWWKTIAIWVDSFRSTPSRYCLITVARILEHDPLEALTIPGSHREALRDAMVTEAQRVTAKREAARSKNSTLPFQDRAAGCATFLGLSASEQIALLNRVTIQPRSFNIADVPAEVARRLQNAVATGFRALVTERLIEWWDRRVAFALLKQRSREITKHELLVHLQELISQHRATSMTDDFSMRKPDPADLAAETMLERQILLVNGGRSRIDRAQLARWRAREQRKKWMGEDVSLATVLQDYDDRLREAWSDRHGPMCDDCKGQSDEVQCTLGRQLLDWTHEKAHQQLPPPRPDWQQPFYMQGTYQQLADELKVGWHPHFRDRLGKPEGDGIE
jgi:hypothetical protein